jgi:hypothetical protein
VLVVVVEAPVARAGPRRGLGVDGLEVVDDGAHRLAQAVEVEAVEAGAAAVVAQPLDELDDHPVAPHPAREADEVAERLLGVAVGAEGLDVAVHARRGRPVGLDGDAARAAALDEPARELGAQRVELVRPVRRLAEQHEPRVADEVAQILDRLRGAAQVGHAPRVTRPRAGRFDVPAPASGEGA